MSESIVQRVRRRGVKICKSRWLSSTSEILYLMILYFLLGLAISFPSVSIQFQLVDKYGLGASSVTLISGVLGVPWIVKPALALVGGWAFPLCCVGTMILYACLLIPMGVIPLLSLLMVSKLGIVFLDVSIDGSMVEVVSKTKSRGGVQSSVFVARTLGGMVGSLGGAFVYHEIHDRLAFACSSVVILFVMLVYSILGSGVRAGSPSGSSAWSSPRVLVKDGWLFVRRHRQFIVFAMLLSLQPSMRGACVYYMQTKLGLSDVDFGILRVCGGISSIMSAVLYGWFGKKLPYRSMVGVGIACSSTVTFVFTVYATYFAKSGTTGNLLFFTVTDLLDALVENFAFMPIMVVASIISKSDHVGGHKFRYAILTSILNMCSTISTGAGALISREEFGDGQSISIGPLTQALLGTEAWSALSIVGVALCMPTSLASLERKESDEESDEESDDEIVTVTL